jgi:hypothetical protein
VLREWLWNGRRLEGRLRYGVTVGLFHGIWLGAWLAASFSRRPAAEAAIESVVGGAALGIFVAVRARRGGCLRLLSAVPPSERGLVMRAVTRGEPVSDPRLAPYVLDCAESVLESVRKSRSPLGRWMFVAVAALPVVLAVVKTKSGPVWAAVFFWTITVMILGLGWAAPWRFARQRQKAERAAELAADLTGR